MDKCCETCLFYRAPAAGETLSRCRYPVPEWLLIGAVGGGWISYASYSGQECMTWKPAADPTPTTEETP